MSSPRTRLPVLVSACLLGRRCRYDGDHHEDPDLRRRLAERGEEALPFCPEETGGLHTPRSAAWIRGSAREVLAGSGEVVTEEGRDVTENYLRGARAGLGLAQQHGALRAYLKERSPSCGVETTHVDGSLVQGRGIMAELLERSGIEVLGIEGRRSKP